VLDIAAGHGRYVLEALTAAPPRAPTRSCCATTATSTCATARALIREKGLEAIARFDKGDAFDRARSPPWTRGPRMGIVSGLYELFPDNDMVSRSCGHGRRHPEPAATWSTPASPGTRSWSSSRAR
jgi:hypothetical protein